MLGLGFDLDELAEPVDGVERDGVLAVVEPLSAFLDRCRRLEADRFYDARHRVSVVDARLKFLAGLRGVIDEWPFIGDLRPLARVVRLPADAERFVRLGELSNRVVVVRIHLRYRPRRLRADRLESGPDPVVLGANLQFDLVHTDSISGNGKKDHGFRPGWKLAFLSLRPR